MSRLVESKPGICFVEFSDSQAASVALHGLNSFRLDATHTLQISFAKAG